MNSHYAEAISRKATALGFHEIGIARAGEIGDDFTRYGAFVEAGMHGEMHWLAEHRDARRRTNGPEILEGARSVIVCALGYARDDGGAEGPPGTRIARYARGADYHNFMRRRLRSLGEFVRTLAPGVEARSVVDTAPVLERAWAQRAGVGFVGKNGCIIVPGLGSFVLLGEVITSLELPVGTPMESRCGACTRCLDECPTGAFAKPYVLDARRCIAYLTIERRGAIDPEFRGAIGDRLFGCDACQDVCPYNRTAVPPAESTGHFALDPRWRDVSLDTLATIDDASFRTLTEGTPVARVGRSGLARNAVTVMGNTRSRRHLPVLREVIARESDATVREAAEHAVSQIERTDER